MTKGQLNKYIEELKIEAVRKVRDDCEVKRSLRKQEIIDNTDMISKFDRIKRYLKKSHEDLKQLKTDTGSSAGQNGYGFIVRLEYLISDLTIDKFLHREDILDWDSQTKAITELEKQSIKAITENYDTLRENCKVYKNSVEAVEYLQTLGFTVPDYEAPKKLMKPLDTRFLIMKGTNKEEEEQA